MIASALFSILSSASAVSCPCFGRVLSLIVGVVVVIRILGGVGGVDVPGGVGVIERF